MPYYITFDSSGGIVLAHGIEWQKHKYIRKEGNRYIYPEDLKKSIGKAVSSMQTKANVVQAQAKGMKRTDHYNSYGRTYIQSSDSTRALPPGTYGYKALFENTAAVRKQQAAKKAPIKAAQERGKAKTQMYKYDTNRISFLVAGLGNNGTIETYKRVEDEMQNASKNIGVSLKDKKQFDESKKNIADAQTRGKTLTEKYSSSVSPISNAPEKHSSSVYTINGPSGKEIHFQPPKKENEVQSSKSSEVQPSATASPPNATSETSNRYETINLRHRSELFDARASLAEAKGKNSVEYKNADMAIYYYDQGIMSYYDALYVIQHPNQDSYDQSEINSWKKKHGYDD